MRQWSRWQDWTNAALGAYVLFVPLFTRDSEGGATVWAAEIFGALIVLVALWALAQPASSAAEWTQAALGALYALAPFYLGYTDLPGAAWNAYIVGALVLVLALWALPQVSRLAKSPEHERIG
jgi:membrane associated rhomboid family serine protease